MNTQTKLVDLTVGDVKRALLLTYGLSIGTKLARACIGMVKFVVEERAKESRIKES